MFKFLTLSLLISVSGMVFAAASKAPASLAVKEVPISARYTVQDCLRDGGILGRGGLTCWFKDGSSIKTDL